MGPWWPALAVAHRGSPGPASRVSRSPTRSSVETGRPGVRIHRASRPAQADPAGLRGLPGTRRARCGRAIARPGAGRLRARPSTAMPGPSGRRRAGHRPPAGRTRVPVRRARAGPGHPLARPGGMSARRAANRFGGSGSWPAAAGARAAGRPEGRFGSRIFECAAVGRQDVIVKLTVTTGDAQAEAAALTGWAHSLLSRLDEAAS
jgi:hypothetical protein